MSENSTLQELDQHNVAKNHENDADDIVGQNTRKDEGSLGMVKMLTQVGQIRAL